MRQHARGLGLAGVMLLVCTATGAPHPAKGQEVHVLPGKNAAFASTTDQTELPAWGPTPVLSTSIARGKRKRVVKIEAMLTVRETGATLPGILPLVNGFGDIVHPFARATGNCSGESTCAMAGTWYVDLDEAESLHPGSFLRKELEIGLLAGDIAGGPDTVLWDASITATMVKK